MTKKLRQKFKYLESEKILRAFDIKQKSFFIIFKGLSLKQIKQFFLADSPILTLTNLYKSPWYYTQLVNAKTEVETD